MSRPLRIEFDGAFYHITTRGNAQQAIFLDDRDKNVFLDTLAYTIARSHWRCHAYCLMGNHYHLLLETPEGNLSFGMRQLNGIYTQAFNRRHGSSGHVFQGRYKAILVDKDSYLLVLCRYLAMNPVRSKTVKSPEKWPWSSYRATIGEVEQPSFLTTEWVLSQFGKDNKSAILKFKEYVSGEDEEHFSWKDLKSQIFLGNSDFIAGFKDLLESKKMLKETPIIQRHVDRPLLQELFRREEMRNKKARDAIIYRASIDYRYKLGEIAEHLKMHYTNVSKAIKRVESNKSLYFNRLSENSN